MDQKSTVRYRYGVLARGQVPDGYICGSLRPDGAYAGGTVDYPQPLPEFQYVRFQLVYMGRFVQDAPPVLSTAPSSHPDAILRALLRKSLEMTALARALPPSYAPIAGRIVCACSLSRRTNGEYYATIADCIQEQILTLNDE